MADDYHSPALLAKGEIVEEPLEECVFCSTNECVQVLYDGLIIHGKSSPNVTPFARMDADKP